MVKYSSVCQRCGCCIKVNAEYQNAQNVMLSLASECPNLKAVSQTPMTLDAMHGLMVPKEKSEFIRQLEGTSHPADCTVYESVVEAIGRSLGRYYEIA